MLTQEQRNRIEQLLLREREETLESIGQLDEHFESLRDLAGELNIYDQHPADYATESQEKEKDFLLASKEGQRLYKIDEALSRLYKDPENFDRCSGCGGRISFERLEVMPEATTCAACVIAAEGDVDADPREADPHAKPARHPGGDWK